MSTATFTLRDLKRQPAKVLAAVRKFGIAEVRTRAGEVFTMTPKKKARQGVSTKNDPDFPALWRRMRSPRRVAR